jgi:hypothetical protein
MPEPPLEAMDLGMYTGGLRLLSIGKIMPRQKGSQLI